MATHKPAQIFASINANAEIPKSKTEVSNPEHRLFKNSNQGNEIQVSATAEMSLVPDRCKMTVHIISKKETPQDAKNSVSRRFDYILQTLKNHQVKEGDITTSKILQRIDGEYQLDAEVTSQFSDFHRCQTVSNLLVEKLDDSVKINLPEFYQSPQKLENLRRQTSLLAAKNAKQKASELAKFLNSSIGKAVRLNEEKCCEWEGSSDSPSDSELPGTIQQRMAMATVHVSVKVSVTFELNPKRKSKETKT